MNNKGFMMAEVVVVSAVILVTLVGLYASYNKIISAYNQRIDYYDVTTLYELANIRENIQNFDSYNSMELVENDIIDDNETVYYLRYMDLERLSESSEISQTFKDYLLYLDGSITIDTYYMLVMERCINNDIDNCKYAYLEVFN